MSGPRIFPKGMELWPTQAINIPSSAVIEAYNSGFVGAYHEPEEAEAFKQDIQDQGGYVYGSDAATASGIADTGKGKLALPFLWPMIIFGLCFPGKKGQGRGDCVPWCERNANLISYGSEIWIGKPDEVTGLVEQAPEIPTTGILDGCFSTEVIYWWRRHNGDGWSCDSSARVSMRECGLVTRDNHPELGVDLTTYSASNAGKYGRTPPSGSIADALDNNLVRTATNLTSREERRDFLYNGYGISSCGSEGFSSKRDENGLSRRSGSWSHAMAEEGFDDRPWTYEVYGDSLELVQNSWAIWNSGPRDIHDSIHYANELIKLLVRQLGITEIVARQKLVQLDILNQATGSLMIPKGSFWARSKDVSRRRFIAKSSVAGWEKRDLFVSLGNEGV